MPSIAYYEITSISMYTSLYVINHMVSKENTDIGQIHVLIIKLNLVNDQCYFYKYNEYIPNSVTFYAYGINLDMNNRLRLKIYID